MNKIIHDCINQILKLQAHVERYAAPTPPLSAKDHAWVVTTTGKVLEIQIIKEQSNPYTNDLFYVYAPVDMSSILLYLDQKYTGLYVRLPRKIQQRLPRPYTYNMTVDENNVFGSKLECQVFTNLDAVQKQLLELDICLSGYGIDDEELLFEPDQGGDEEMINPEPHFDKPNVDWITPRILSDQVMQNVKDQIEEVTNTSNLK